ncbi:hypothetical protein PG993_012297 [Apiospora rasikravindrae]|uniref:SNF2 N-terminal domain-containing protein n=1 Tax=Apiospora rasikravindrae TaxID=990691 RepID=A0ABR1S3T9_9PEZI
MAVTRSSSRKLEDSAVADTSSSTTSGKRTSTNAGHSTTSQAKRARKGNYSASRPSTSDKGKQPRNGNSPASSPDSHDGPTASNEDGGDHNKDGNDQPSSGDSSHQGRPVSNTLRAFIEMEAFFSHFGQELFRFEQLFGAECVPFKQAFASRNSGCVMFRDVCELTMDNDTATTAKGEVMTIPRDPTILIAGTSCVDFSSLSSKKQNGFSDKITNLFDAKNPNRKTPTFDEVSELLGEITKDIHSLGESEQTFFSMLSYVAGHKPWIVILENVMSAPFEEARDYWFNALGYTAWAGSLDTKDFYIPQTRKRKYLVAFRDDKFPHAINACDILGKAIDHLKQPALPNIEDFLLGANNPLTQIARLELEEKAQKPKTRKEVSWEYSQIRHETVRDKEGLGDSRPLTQWKENGRPKFHDGLDKFAWSALPNRVYDVLDINWLRGVLGTEPFDLLFKVKVLDLSQNVDRHLLQSSFGISGCLTPSGGPYITNQCRFVLGYECLNLQGLPLWKIDFSRETQDQLKDLAGNAMSTPVVGAVILASLMASLDDKDMKSSPWKTELGDTSDYPSLFTSSSPPLNPGEEEMGIVKEYNIAGFVEFSVETIKAEVRNYRRYCHCNGTTRYSARELMKCNICGIIRCINCAGNPVHDYRPTAPSPEPKPFRAVEHAFLRYFPTVITGLLNPSWKKNLRHLSHLSTILMNGSYKTSADSKTTTIFEALAKAKFLYQRFHITEVATLVYTSDDGFELKVVCTELGVDWFVTLDTYSSSVNTFLQSNEELLKFCKRSQPFMKGTVLQKADSPLQVKWFMWDFAPSKVEAIISCTEETGGKFIDVELANILEIDGELFSKVNEEVSGRYEAAPKCEAAEYSLSVRQVPGESGQSVKLFKDPTLLGPPSQDPFVIAYEHRKLTSNEHREFLLKFSPEAKLHKLDGGYKGTFEAETASRPILSDEYLPSDPLLLLQRLGWICNYEPWAVVPTKEERALFETLGYATAKSIECIKERMQIVELGAARCEDCAPQLPVVSWNGTTPFSNHEDIESYERARKRQPPTFQIQVSKEASTEDEMKGFKVRFVFNPVRLAHKAFAQLPVEKTALLVAQAPIITTARVKPQYVDILALQLKPFAHSLVPLSETWELEADDEDPFPATKMKLLFRQKMTVAWMLRRERAPKPFIEREMEEDYVDGIHTRVVGYASRMVIRRGGIVADDIGYGKTVMVLAILNLQREFDRHHYQLRLKHSTNGIEALDCNLIICPKHIVSQWGDEIGKFLSYRKGHEFALINTWNDLKETDLKLHNVLVLSDGLFGDPQYSKALETFADTKNPSHQLTPKALREWEAGRGYREWYEAAVKIIESKKAKKRSLLEQYSFNRVVWDEVSYSNPTVSSFVANCRAISKWLLSGTPPTQSLSDVCSMARTIGLHIARPIDLCPGLPSIAKGPSQLPRTGFEEMNSWAPLKTTANIAERHSQGENFFNAFSVCNKIDLDSREFQVMEWALVVPSTLTEMSIYLPLQDDMRKADMEAESLSGDGSKILERILENAGESLDGENVCATTLSHVATAPSLATDLSSLRGSPHSVTSHHQRALKKREDMMKEARVYVAYSFERLIWLATRLYRTLHRPGQPDAKTAAKMTAAEKKAAKKKAEDDADEYLVITRGLSAFLDDLNNGTLKKFNGRHNYAELAKAILRADPHQIDAKISRKEALLGLDKIQNYSGRLMGPFTTHDDNINLMYRFFNSKWAKFYLLDVADVRNTGKIPREDVINLLLPYDERTIEELEAETEQTLRSKLEAVVQGLLQERVSELAENQQEYERTHADESGDLLAILRREGVKVGSAKSKPQLIQAYDDHKKKALGMGCYNTPREAACHAATTMPFIEEKVKARGSDKWQTKYEYYSAWNAFLKACRYLYEHSAQLRRARLFHRLDAGETMTCDEKDCETPTDSLALISECGHVLCQYHRENKLYCGDGTNGCTANLDAGVIQLSRFAHAQDRQIKATHLPSPVGDRTSAYWKLDSKLKYVIDLIQTTAVDDKVVLFAQHQLILEKALEALDQCGITNTTTNTAVAKKRDNDEKDPLGDFKLGKYKVLVMKVNSPEAAGGNLTIANHVIFLSPVIANSQPLYDSHMNQAAGRCIRHGQKKDVHVYHCVTEGTIEVDILELRKHKEVRVRPGFALGGLVPRKFEGRFGDKDTTNDVTDGDKKPHWMGDWEGEPEAVRSLMSSHEVWKGLAETDLALIMDIEDPRADSTGAYMHKNPKAPKDPETTNNTETTEIPSDSTSRGMDSVAAIHALDQFAGLSVSDRAVIENQYNDICAMYEWAKVSCQDNNEESFGDDGSNSPSENDDNDEKAEAMDVDNEADDTIISNGARRSGRNRLLYKKD